MKNNFEEHEIASAVFQSELAELVWDSEDHNWEVADRELFWKLNRFIEALPEPEDDDWQECEYSDFRPGDQLKYETPVGVGYLHEPLKKENFVDGLIWFEGDSCLPQRWDFKYFRIPAPVTHPNPEIHQLIRDERDGEIMQASKGQYIDKFGNFWPAHDFTNWTPLKVVDDE